MDFDCREVRINWGLIGVVAGCILLWAGIGCLWGVIGIIVGTLVLWAATGCVLIGDL